MNICNSFLASRLGQIRTKYFDVSLLLLCSYSLIVLTYNKPRYPLFFTKSDAYNSKNYKALFTLSRWLWNIEC